MPWNGGHCGALNGNCQGINSHCAACNGQCMHGTGAVCSVCGNPLQGTCAACAVYDDFAACGCMQDPCGGMCGCATPYPMTFEEMLQLLCGVRYGRVAVVVEGVVHIAPVRISVRRSDDTPIFTLRLRTDSSMTTYLTDATAVTLQFDRMTACGMCTVEAQGTAQVTGSTGCMTVVEVRAATMTGECYRRGCCDCE